MDRWLFYVLFIVLAILEFIGVFDSKFDTITGIICQYIPAWLRAAILGWIVFHFLIQHQK